LRGACCVRRYDQGASECHLCPADKLQFSKVSHAFSSIS
jgi:hypothetical protein